MEIAKVKLNFNYDSPESEEIQRNLVTLYSVRQGEQPLDREFGLDWSYISQIPSVTESRYLAEVTRKTARYEPRVEVVSVVFETDAVNGMIHPIITLRRKR